MEACRRLGVDVRVARITVLELDRVVAAQRSLVAKVANQVPDESLEKIRGGLFLKRFRSAQEGHGQPCFDEIFPAFLEPAETLRESFGATLVDDAWFDAVERDRETQDLARTLAGRYFAMRGRSKSITAATHDALMLRWVNVERQGSAQRTWLVTVDSSLPGFVPRVLASADGPPALSLDGLLVWMSPHAGLGEGLMAEVFGEAIRQQVLPQERFLDLRDFELFADLGLSCRELPAQDVEGCIRFLRENFERINPGDARGREELAHEVARFFHDPGRRYKSDIARYEAELTAASSIIREKDRELERLSEELEKAKKEDEERQAVQVRSRLRRSAGVRLGIAAVALAVLLGALVFVADSWAEGGNLAQRVIAFWPALGTAVALWLVATARWIGKERLATMPWVAKILRR
jgi:hypothetical protein